MKFTTSAVIASTLAIVSASPIATADNSSNTDPFAATKPSVNEPFRLMSLRTGTPIQFGNVQAVKGGLSINALKQDSYCTEPDVNYATFTLTPEGDLYLYTPNPPLQAYVDRSGMGQGALQFTTGVQPIGRNQERGPFAIDDQSNLVFAANNGIVGFQACPGTAENGWSVWLSGVSTPAGIEGCTPFTMKALKEETPVRCNYNGMST
ncbi:hypothetical protein G6011_06162 [Alternaria panax]|uniref:Cell wall protein PhiA n=1 Tax=Alternaria panax TaxID=48097 RepID=A0AAD4FEY1_9PLEO|nr:hypothetical protein G6011_06162 [Alternaria panax]